MVNKQARMNLPCISFTFPFWFSVVGSILTCCFLLLREQPAIISIFNLGIVNITFNLDRLNGFFLLLLFICNILYLLFNRSLLWNSRYIISCFLVIFLFLSGNLFLTLCFLSLFLIVNFGKFHKKGYVFFLIFIGSLGSVSIVPYSTYAENSFAGLPFTLLRNQSYSWHIFLFLLVPLWFLSGLYPFHKWRAISIRNYERNQFYIYQPIFMSLIGFYGLTRVGLDFCQKQMPFSFAVGIALTGLVASVVAGLMSLKEKGFYRRVNCLFIVNEGLLIQLLCTLLIEYSLNKDSFIIFGNEILFFSIFVQILGFTLMFLSGTLVKSKEGEQEFVPFSKVNLFLLIFLLSVCPPFTGFIMIWGNLQLWCEILSNHYLLGMLLIMLFAGLNAFIFLCSFLGWLNLLLVENKKNILLHEPFFVAVMEKTVFGLFLLFLFPGLITFLINPVPLPYSYFGINTFFGFTNKQMGFSFIPIVPLFIFLVILLGMYLNVRKNQKLQNVEEEHTIFAIYKRFKYCEQTQFHFNPVFFYSLLSDVFCLVKLVNYYRNGLWIFCRIRGSLKKAGGYLNNKLWQQHELLIFGVMTGILLIGLLIQ